MDPCTAFRAGLISASAPHRRMLQGVSIARGQLVEALQQRKVRAGVVIQLRPIARTGRSSPARSVAAPAGRICCMFMGLWQFRTRVARCWSRSLPRADSLPTAMLDAWALARMLEESPVAISGTARPWSRPLPHALKATRRPAGSRASLFAGPNRPSFPNEHQALIAPSRVHPPPWSERCLSWRCCCFLGRLHAKKGVAPLLGSLEPSWPESAPERLGLAVVGPKSAASPQPVMDRRISILPH